MILLSRHFNEPGLLKGRDIHVIHRLERYQKAIQAGALSEYVLAASLYPSCLSAIYARDTRGYAMSVSSTNSPTSTLYITLDLHTDDRRSFATTPTSL